MKVTVTGATGLIGTALVGALKARGDEVTVLSRDPARAERQLGVEAQAWDPLTGPAPASALSGRDGVVHLAGEPVAQRWTADVKRAIRASRDLGTANLVAGIAASEPRPSVLVSSSAVGYYGKHGDEIIDESTPAGADFLAEVCVEWERRARAAEELGLRVVIVRTGVVLDADGGALKTMLPPFKAGVGGPVAGGRQYMPWIHVDDIVGIYLSALDEVSWSGPVNGTAPDPVTNAEFSKALGRALKRPAIFPVPAIAIRTLYGEMSEIVTEGQRAVPARTLELGYRFSQPDLDAALASALGR
ncbi:MAG: TIGR01777 family oxidoreductase [Acidobacteria bacterium]|nr:TIGR01777 family oxidoreductase [Acidobacteriota bacterium]